jgi:hypothetical protein
MHYLRSRSRKHFSTGNRSTELIAEAKVDIDEMALLIRLIFCPFHPAQNGPNHPTLTVEGGTPGALA